MIELDRPDDYEPFARERLKLVPWSEIHLLPKREGLISGLLDCGGMSLVYGPSGCCKTFLVMDMAAHISLGWEWRGRKIKQGAVIYIAAEGGLGIEERLTAFRHHHEIDAEGVPLFIIPEPIDLCRSSSDTKLLLERIADMPVSMIVTDTVSRAMSGGNENSPDDMGAFVRHCDQLRMETKAHVMLVHHAGKDDSRGARGHSLLKAAADTEIEVAKSEGGLVTATVTKQRDYPGGERMGFRLQSLELEGEDRAACVLVPADAMASGSGGKRRPLPKAASIALKALQKAADEVGTKPPASNNIPPNTKTVSEDQWRKYAYAIGISTGGERAQQSAFARGCQTLVADSFAGAWQGHYWPCT